MSRARIGALLLLSLSGCAARIDHVGAGPPPVVPAASEPAAPDGRQARLVFFLDMADALGPLDDLRRRAPPAGSPPWVGPLPDVERAVLARRRGPGPFGPVLQAAAVGTAGRVPLSPRAMADLLLDPEVERQVLAADEFRLLRTAFEVPGALRRSYQAEMRNMGHAPFQATLRFATDGERWDLADGSVLLRYDLKFVPRPEHVTLWRGACVIEPDPAGALVTEFLVLGTDLRVPFFLEASLRALSLETLENRAVNLFRRARAPR